MSALLPLAPCSKCAMNIGGDNGLCATCDQSSALNTTAVRRKIRVALPVEKSNTTATTLPEVGEGGGKKVEPTALGGGCVQPLKENSSHYIRNEMPSTASSTAHALYERLNMIVMSGTMTAKQNKKGEWKKTFGFRSGWEKTPKHDYSKSVNGYAMLTGERTGIIAIDIDDPELEHNQKLMDMMTECNFVQKTNKGFHYVFKYDERLKQTTGQELALDVRSDGGCIFCEPTLATTPDGAPIASYEWIKTPFEDEEISTIPDEVVEYLAELDGRYVGRETSVEEEVMENVFVPVVNEVVAEVTAPVTDNLLVKVLDALNVKRWDNYDDWVKVGMICYNEKLPLSVWDTMSKKSRSYEEGGCARKWATFGKERSGQKLSQATLWKWLKADDATAFYSLMERREDFYTLIALLNHKDIAKHFYNIHPDAYLWHESLGWYSLTKDNIWKHYDKSQPSGLKRHIADTFQDLAMDTKKAELAKYAKESAKVTDQDKQKELLKKHTETIKAIHTAYKTFGSSDFCNGVIAFLPSFYEKEDLETTMDMNRYIFSFTDGCFDLNLCKFRPISPSDYVSTTTGYAYPKRSDPDVRRKLKAFLNGLFEDAPTEKYLTQVLASCLFGGNRWEEFYGFTGSGGNGKGVIADLLKTAFGDYYLSVDNTLFTKPLERKDQPIPALVEARCKRIMMTTEPESDDKLQGGLIKKISGGDIIEARTLHSKHIVKYVPQFKVILQMNNIPKMSKIDGGIERRMRIIQFPFKFVAEPTEPYHRKGDPDVKEKHCKSAEWRDEFILLLSEVYAEIKDLKALKAPKSVSEATGEYIDDNNPLKMWLNRYYKITKAETDMIQATELKRQYLQDNNIEKMADQSFKNLLGFNGINRKHTNTGNYYVGLKRKSDEEIEAMNAE